MFARAGQQHQAHFMKRGPGGKILRVVLSILGTILALIILAWAILFITKGRFLKPYFEDYLSNQTRREVKVAGDFQLFLNPINIKFLAERMSISNPAWASRRHFFESGLIDTNIATLPLIFGDRRVNWLNLIDGNFDLEWDSAGQRNTWTMGDPNRKGEPFDMPTIRRAMLSGTSLRYRAPQMQFLADVQFETVRGADTRFESDIRFSGGGSVRGNAFTLSGNLLSPNETVAGGQNRLALRAASAGNTVSVRGTLPGPTEIEGGDLRFEARGPNLASLFNLAGIAVPDTRRYRIRSALTKQDDRWRFTGLRGTFGASDIAGAMTVAMPANRLRLDADLRSRMLDIIDVGPWVGYNPERLDRLGPKGAITNEGGRPRVLPDAPLRTEALKAFDAHVDYRVAKVRMENFPISNIGLRLDLERSRLSLSPLTFDVAGGHLSSDIVINARVRPVVTDYDIRLSPTPMGRLLAKFGAEESGTTGTIKARVQLKGYGDSVRQSLGSSSGRIALIMPAGTFWTRNVQLAELDIGTFAQKMFEKRLKEPVRINCGLIAFTVRNGVASADPILIDTQKNVIGGRGAFSFRNEALDLAVEADAKTMSLFSAQSPIGVGGYFAAPSISVISGELVARAGVGLGLGLVASPLAAVVAFIDPGNAEDTACGPVLAGARAYAQREVDGGKVKHIGQGKAASVKPEKKKKKFLGIF